MLKLLKMFQLLGLTKKEYTEKKKGPEMFIKAMSLFRVGQPRCGDSERLFFSALYLHLGEFSSCFG